MKIICFDTSILIPWFMPIEQAKDELEKNKILRIKKFLKTLSKDTETLIIPAVALAEVLAGFSKESKPNITEQLKSKFKIISFDIKCAFLAANIFEDHYETIKKDLKEEQKDKFDKQKVKVDFQIIATAQSINADILYTEDNGMLRTSSRIGGLLTRNIPEVEEQKVLELKLKT